MVENLHVFIAPSRPRPRRCAGLLARSNAVTWLGETDVSFLSGSTPPTVFLGGLGIGCDMLRWLSLFIFWFQDIAFVFNGENDDNPMFGLFKPS